MIKNIFVPINGDAANDSVFATALAVARPLAAHMEFFHMRFSPCAQAVRTRHVEYCVGTEINMALERLRQQDELASRNASQYFQDFCEENAIAIRSTPKASTGLGADLLQETDHAEARLLFHARHSDLVVIGRPHEDDLTPYRLIETLLLGSGQPIIIAPNAPPKTVTDTIMVGWKDSPQAVRSVSRAIPLLKRARRVVLVQILEGRHASDESLNALCQSLAWHGITAATRALAGQSNPALQLKQTAVEESATLMVLGGYSHRPVQEAVLGGISRTMIEDADLPVFLMH